jgi:3-hydroxyacyl-CoA dehydrogenase/enoyl-CoA hydratase/3-hydroxybutyryl-CoA epimerase
MLDETGLALNWQQARQAKADGLDDRFCRTLAWPVLDSMVSRARRGRRDGGGFYDYPEGQAKRLWAVWRSCIHRCRTSPPSTAWNVA